MSLFAAANVIGAIVVFLFLNLTAADRSVHEAMEQLTWGPTVLAGYGLVFAAFSVAVAWQLFASIDWWYEGRTPSIDERRGALLLPRRFTILSALGWFGGNTTFTIASAINGTPEREIVRSVVGTALGGATTCAICYLLVERVLRPIFAAALRDGLLPIKTLGVRPRMMLAWALGSAIPLVSIAVSPIGPEDESIEEVAALALIGLIAGGLMIGIATRSVSDRLAGIRAAIDSVGAGDLSVVVRVDEAGEIGMLQTGVNQMVHGLRERQVIADLFGRHVGPDVARLALAEGVHLGGEQRDVTVLFLDVTGSTWLAATTPATEVVAKLNVLFSAVVRIVEEEGGWVDKFEGDAALCVFGAPAPLRDHPTRALRAARRLCAEVHALDFGIGVSSGNVVAGNVGSETRFEYTVIGDPVNEAARLTEAAKTRPIHVLASQRAADRADADERRFWQPADTIHLRGRPEPTPTYEPVG